MTPELTVDEALVMAAECPVIRAAYASEDADVIKRIEAAHPAKRCHYVKEAKAEAEKVAAEKAEAEKAKAEAEKAAAAASG
jgi:hypothetical protein